jgi:acid phosphatase
MLHRLLLLALALVATGAPLPAATLPRPAHVVVVVEENHGLRDVIATSAAPYMTALARSGALFTHAYGVTHPSLPNYFAMFAGLTNDNGDGCPATGVPRDAPNLASELLAAHLTFTAYSESLPSTGFTGCWAGQYARKHAPWVHFSNVPQTLHHPFSALRSYDSLPTITFIVPDQDDDMHDGTVRQADDWARTHLDPLVRWARTHDTLVIFTWDEGIDDANSIPTFFVGPMVRQDAYAERIDHYRLLRTLEDMYALRPTGRAAAAQPIVNCWR